MRQRPNNFRSWILMLVFFALSGLAAVAQTVMPWTPQDLKKIMEQHKAAPQFVAPKNSGPTEQTVTSVNLYPYLTTIPSQRDQGSCGNCWAWGTAAAMEIALRLQNGVADRLSVQFINSCMSSVIGKACCDAGSLQDVVNFYNHEGFAIPWSNANANWTSGGGSCITGSTITTAPRYPISSFSYSSIATGSDQAASIANVKAALNQNKALYFFFYLPTTAAWNAFDDFYFNQSTNVLWNNFYCGVANDAGSGGHVVCCIGYYDDGGANRYWLMLNQWGAPSLRPQQIFHVAMDLDYNCSPCGFETVNIGWALAPIINSQPQARTNMAGTTATFSIATAPGTPLTYQWQKDSVNVSNGSGISGATTSVLTIASVTTNHAGSYKVTMSYGSGSTNSAAANLTVLAPPYLINQPVNQTFVSGSSAPLSVVAGGTGPLTFQWKWNSLLYPPGTNSFNASKAGSYICIITNVAGAVTSQVATMTVVYPPQIVTDPQSQSSLTGTPVTFTVSATGTDPMTYRWQWNSQLYPPGTNTFNASKAGNYTCIISNPACSMPGGGGPVTSAVAVLIFTNPPPALPAQFSGICRLTNGLVQLTLSGTPGTNYVLESTTDWTHWTSVSNWCASNGLFQICDPATNDSLRFYRARLLSP